MPSAAGAVAVIATGIFAFGAICAGRSGESTNRSLNALPVSSEMEFMRIVVWAEGFESVKEASTGELSYTGEEIWMFVAGSCGQAKGFSTVTVTAGELIVRAISSLSAGSIERALPLACVGMETAAKRHS